MTKIWNFGIVGAGLIADVHAQAIQSIPNVRLKGICGSNADKATRLAGKYNCRVFKDLNGLLSDNEIDIVTIATPSGAHMEPTIEAARHGKHVICEKPMEISLERIDKMIDAHLKSGTRLGGIFNFRFNDSIRSLKHAIENARFGQITFASIQVPWWRSNDYYKHSWHGTLKLDGGGALMNQTIHMIDLLQYLMGPIDSLQAYSATLGHSIEVEDTATAILKFNNNTLGAIYGTTASYPGQSRTLMITGTQGTVIMVDNNIKVWQFASQTDNDIQIQNSINDIEGRAGASDPADISFTSHARNFEAFVQSVESGAPFEIDGTEARKAVEIVLRIYSSAKQENVY